MSVEIDLRQDSLRIAQYIAQRCQNFPVYINAGPGRDEDEIHQITLGYGVDQAGWVALVFDTRPDAQLDGEWQAFIEQNAESFPDWTKAFNKMLKGNTLVVTTLKGKKKAFTEDSEYLDVMTPFGEMCRDLLLRARKDGLLKKLPLAKNCRLSVEEHEGHYGWDNRPAKPSEPDAQSIFKDWQQEAKNQPKSEQTEFWLKKLDKTASREVYRRHTDRELNELVFKELSRQPRFTTEPLLKWAIRWAKQPEFKSYELKEREDASLPHQTMLCMVFWAIQEWGIASPEAEKLIRKFIQTATSLEPIDILRPKSKEAEKEAAHHGISPWHAARLLHSRFEGYPEPKINPYTNELLDREVFCDVKALKKRAKK